jgi:ribonuclease HII
VPRLPLGDPVKIRPTFARERAAMKRGVFPVAGCDEAGRGPLAGPVVAAAVILDPGVRWTGVADSKLIDPETRAELYARVLLQARAFGWAVIGPRAIDRMNIRRASLEAMRRAVARLRLAPTMVLVDGMDRVPGLMIAQEAVIDGDAKMLSIAAASIVAKVVRDRIMERLDRVWPAYGFVRHKGYSTPEHLDVLGRIGPCPIHRYSYAPVAFQNLPFDGPPEIAAEVVPPPADVLPAAPATEPVSEPAPIHMEVR